jgi:hypothetical protein
MQAMAGLVFLALDLARECRMQRRLPDPEKSDR